MFVTIKWGVAVENISVFDFNTTARRLFAAGASLFSVVEIIFYVRNGCHCVNGDFAVNNIGWFYNRVAVLNNNIAQSTVTCFEYLDVLCSIFLQSFMV